MQLNDQNLDIVMRSDPVYFAHCHLMLLKGMLSLDATYILNLIQQLQVVFAVFPIILLQMIGIIHETIYYIRKFNKNLW